MLQKINNYRSLLSQFGFLLVKMLTNRKLIWQYNIIYLDSPDLHNLVSALDIGGPRSMRLQHGQNPTEMLKCSLTESPDPPKYCERRGIVLQRSDLHRDQTTQGAGHCKFNVLMLKKEKAHK